MSERAYEVVEKATQWRTYFVFARTAREAKEKVLLGTSEPHWANSYDNDGMNPVITSVKRSPEFDPES